MFYQEPLPTFWIVSRVDSLLTIADRHRRTLAATFEKVEFTSVCTERMPFYVGCLFLYRYLYINAMWLLKSKWVPIFMGCLFCVCAYYFAKHVTLSACSLLLRWQVIFKVNKPGIQANGILCLLKILAHSPFWESEIVHCP